MCATVTADGFLHLSALCFWIAVVANCQGKRVGSARAVRSLGRVVCFVRGDRGSREPGGRTNAVDGLLAATEHGLAT